RCSSRTGRSTGSQPTSARVRPVERPAVARRLTRLRLRSRRGTQEPRTRRGSAKRKSMFDSVVVADHFAPAASRGSAEATPTRPEDEREQGAAGTDDQEDPADRVQVDGPVRRYVHGPDEDRPGRNEDHAHTNAHVVSFTVCRGKRASGRI